MSEHDLPAAQAPGAGAHVGVDVLADLDEGLLAPHDEAAARRHLAGCASCRATAASLAALRADLAADDPGPMPAELASRLGDALAAASVPPDRAATVLSARPEPPRQRGDQAELARTPAPSTAAATVTPLADRRRPLPRWLPAAAGIVAVTVAAVLGLHAMGDRGGRPAGTTAASGGAEAGTPGAATKATAPLVTASGRDYTADTVARGSLSLLGLGGASGGKVATPASPASPASPLAPDRAKAAGPSTGGSPTSAPLARLAADPGLGACVRALTGGSGEALAVDLASYDGAPAALVVLATPGDPSSVDAWVVGPGCGQGSDAQVRYFRRVPR